VSKIELQFGFLAEEAAQQTTSPQLPLLMQWTAPTQRHRNVPKFVRNAEQYQLPYGWKPFFARLNRTSPLLGQNDMINSRNSDEGQLGSRGSEITAASFSAIPIR